MPYSHDRFDEYIKAIIKNSGYDNWLDIGAGAGKYGKMIKGICPEAHVTGIEINAEYVDKFSLGTKYDDIRIMNAMNIMAEPHSVYEGIILGDVLEHMPKSCGIDLINFLIYRCKIMIIVYPLKRHQNGWKGFDSEAHISVWGETDWDSFDGELILDPASHLVMLDGFLEHERIDIDVVSS